MFSKRNPDRHIEGATEYTTCNSLLNAASLPANAGSAVFQIAANGVPLSKIVIGKPANTADANNGYIDPTTLAGCVSQAKAQGWSELEPSILHSLMLIISSLDAGVMVWQVILVVIYTSWQLFSSIHSTRTLQVPG
jgi:chitinase